MCAGNLLIVLIAGKLYCTYLENYVIFNLYELSIFDQNDYYNNSKLLF